MLKIGLASTIFICVTYFGFYYGEKFKDRDIQLKEIIKLIILLNNEILYNATPLPEAFKNISTKTIEPFRELLKDISYSLTDGNAEGVYSCIKENAGKYKDKISLQETDKRILKDFLKSLGESGVYGQEKIFNLTLNGLKINSKEAEENSKKNTKMYRVIGACIGAMIAIFII